VFKPRQGVARTLDVAWKWDCTAIVALWMPSEEVRLFDRTTILEPPRDGNMLNPHLIEDAFVELHSRNPVERVVMDREKGEQLACWIEEELGAEVVERSRSNGDAAEDFEKFHGGAGVAEAHRRQRVPPPGDERGGADPAGRQAPLRPPEHVARQRQGAGPPRDRRPGRRFDGEHGGGGDVPPGGPDDRGDVPMTHEEGTTERGRPGELGGRRPAQGSGPEGIGVGRRLVPPLRG
jgi:hypothetical protein